MSDIEQAKAEYEGWRSEHPRQRYPVKPVPAYRKAEDTPENRELYRGLMGVYGLMFCADGIKSFLIHQLQTTCVWTLSGETQWPEFCQRYLHVNRRTADRMASEGNVARRLLFEEPRLKELLCGLQGVQVVRMLLDTDNSFSTDVMADMPSARLAVVKDRKLQRTVSAAPYEAWTEIVDAAARTGQVTTETIKAAAAPYMPQVETPPSPPRKPSAGNLADHLRTLQGAAEDLDALLNVRQWTYSDSKLLAGVIASLRIAARKLKVV